MMEFKKGDVVIDVITGGVGQVVFVRYLGDYPIEVSFNRGIVKYTKGGLLHATNKIRRLYHTWENPRIVVNDEKAGQVFYYSV
jgi:hypothetical protein